MNEHLKAVKSLLHRATPLATVLQHIVIQYLHGAHILFVVDSNGHTLRVVSLDDRTVRTIAGQDDNPAHADGTGANALFSMPSCLAIDQRTGMLFVGDHAGTCIRCVNKHEEVSTLCGKPGCCSYREGTGEQALFNSIHGIAVTESDVYVTDTNNHCIRRINRHSATSCLHAGRAGTTGFEDGIGSAKFSFPEGLAAGPHGLLFVADRGNRAIRVVSASGTVSTLVGVSRHARRDGRKTVASFCSPRALAYDEKGSLFVRDASIVRRVDVHTGSVVSLCHLPDEQGKFGFFDGVKKKVRLLAGGIAVDHTGDIYVSSTRQVIERIEPSGHMCTVCGVEDTLGHVDGNGALARFNYPSGIALL